MAWPRRWKRKPLAIVLFSGIGGGTFGLQKAGYKVVLAIDLDEEDACNENHERLTGIPPVSADLMFCNVRKLCRKRGINPDSIALILISPPCEGITRAKGRQDPADERNRLIERVPAMVAKQFARAFLVVENVATLVRGLEMAPVFETMRRNLMRAGRRVPTRTECAVYCMDAADYGIAQRRPRVFIPIPPGKRVPFPEWPRPTHSEAGGAGLAPWVSFGDALQAMQRDPCPFGPPFRDAEYACYGAADSEWTRNYKKKIAKRAERKWGVKNYKTLLVTDPQKPLPCLTASMRRPSRVTGVHPYDVRFLTCGELLVAAFGFPSSSPMLDIPDIRKAWDAIADAIVPRCAELVGRAVAGEYPASHVPEPENPKALGDSVWLYPGAKASIAERIVDALAPAIMEQGIYYEPFCGSGAVALEVARRFPDAQIFLNDLDADVAAYWRIVASGTAAQRRGLARLLAQRPSKALFDRYAKHEQRTEAGRIFRSILTNRFCYNNYEGGGFLKARIKRYPSDLPARFRSHIDLFQGRLTVSSCHFREFLRRAPKDAPLYLDPPYWQIGKKFYRHWMQEAEHAELAKMLKARKNWLLSYGEAPEIRGLYSGRKIERIKAGRKKGELIIS